MVDKSLYTIILSQVFSPCRHFFVAGNIYGEIAVYLMRDIFSSEGENLSNEKKPKKIINTSQNEKVCSLAASKRSLIAGTVGKIYAWDWVSLPKKDLEVSWNISLPCKGDCYDKPDVNSLVVSDTGDSSFLFAGCGDAKIYMYSLEDGHEIRTFEGHSSFIHSISHHGDTLASCAEDGWVKLWDIRQPSVVHQVSPCEEESLARPNLGSWIGDVSIHDKYLVCGGGPKAGIWTPTGLQLICPLDEGRDRGIHISKMTGNQVIVGGVLPNILVYSTNGKLTSKLPSSSSTNYIAQALEEPDQILVYGGNSNQMDICRGLTTRTQILTFP